MAKTTTAKPPASRRKASTTKSKVAVGIIDEVRQQMQPTEYRVAPPAEAAPTPAQPAGQRSAIPLIIELVNCLWHLKTKHFRRKWSDEDNADEDPRTRRALGRLNRGMAALTQSGIAVIDRTGERYVAGSEGSMRPAQLLPTVGITFDMVADTIRPAIMLDGQMIQAGEALIAVPRPIQTAPDLVEPVPVETAAVEAAPAEPLPTEPATAKLPLDDAPTAFPTAIPPQ
jgi:hypothetical protein